MRYCINCGSKLENGRFCTACGKDNGEEPSTNRSDSSSTAQNPIVWEIIDYAAIILFSISALILLIMCLNNCMSVLLKCAMWKGSIISSVIYFIAGMWSTAAAVHLISNIKNKSGIGTAAVSIALIVIMIVESILKAVGGHIENLGFFEVMFPYTKNIAVIIILCAVAAAIKIFSVRKNIKEDM